jgi:hypothetical protein
MHGVDKGRAAAARERAADERDRVADERDRAADQLEIDAELAISKRLGAPQER